jgi:5-carboxymethyl-2-hydroxymuconate isomerase
MAMFFIHSKVSIKKNRDQEREKNTKSSLSIIGIDFAFLFERRFTQFAELREREAKVRVFSFLFVDR